MVLPFVSQIASKVASKRTTRNSRGKVAGSQDMPSPRVMATNMLIDDSVRARRIHDKLVNEPKAGGKQAILSRAISKHGLGIVFQNFDLSGSRESSIFKELDSGSLRFFVRYLGDAVSNGESLDDYMGDIADQVRDIVYRNVASPVNSGRLRAVMGLHHVVPCITVELHDVLSDSKEVINSHEERVEFVRSLDAVKQEGFAI